MCKKITQNEFILKAKEIHGDKYDYSLSVYNTAHEKIKIKCNKCNSIFIQSANQHTSGRGCKKCWIDSKMLTPNQLIAKAKLVHSNKYNYSKIKLPNSPIKMGTKIKIICNKCKYIFYPSFISHIKGSGCKRCSYKSKTMTTKEFIKKSKQTHGNKFNYSLSKYTHSKNKIKIKCKKCSLIFKVFPYNHMTKGVHCPKCNNIKQTFTLKEFIAKAKRVHGNKYSYSKVKYKNMITKIKITCNKCLKHFYQEPGSHIYHESGCPNCKESRGELKVSSILTKNKIKYYPQHKFQDCKSKKGFKLKFDFYVPSFNLCIEYDGEQHFDTGNKWHTPFVVENDRIKDKYCKINNIKMLRISYKDFKNVESIISHIIK